MKLQAYTELQGEVLVTTATGTVAFEPAVQILKGVCDLAAEKGVHKILVNTLATEGTFATMERYQLAIQITEHMRQLQFNPRMAVVGVPPTKRPSGNW